MQHYKNPYLVHFGTFAPFGPRKPLFESRNEFTPLGPLEPPPPPPTPPPPPPAAAPRVPVLPPRRTPALPGYTLESSSNRRKGTQVSPRNQYIIDKRKSKYASDSSSGEDEWSD